MKINLPDHSAAIKRRIWIIILVICSAVTLLPVGWIILINGVIPSPPLVISEETTRVTGPLTERGYIDFFKALEQRFTPPELATDANGYRDFVRLFGDIAYKREPEDREFYRLQLYEKLGLDPDVPPTMVLPDIPVKIIEDFYNERGVTGWRSFLPEPGGEPWTLEKYPILADWVNEIDAPLDAIAEALRKEVFYPPLLLTSEVTQRAVPPELFSILLGETTRTYNFSFGIIQHFSARAGYRIAQGNIDGAIDDTISILRWSRYVARTGTLIQYIIGFAFEERARTIPIGGNPEHPLTEQQIRRFLAELDALPPHRPYTEAVEWERSMMLSFVQIMAIGDIHSVPPVEWFPSLQTNPFVRFSRLNWNVVFRRINEMYDATLEPPPRTKLAAILDETDIASGRGGMIGRVLYSALIPGGKDVLVADIINALLAPMMDRQRKRVQQFGCAKNMQRLALAILLYEREHGTTLIGDMPDENWAAKIAKYLGDNPEQYFSCPVHPTAKGETRYALIQYGDTVTGSLMLVELAEAVPLKEGVMTVDEMLKRKRWDGCNIVALRNGAVRNVWNEAILLQMLGRGE